jgi:hypothetical protein
VGGWGGWRRRSANARKEKGEVGRARPRGQLGWQAGAGKQSDGLGREVGPGQYPRRKENQFKIDFQILKRIRN